MNSLLVPAACEKAKKTLVCIEKPRSQDEGRNSLCTIGLSPKQIQQCEFRKRFAVMKILKQTLPVLRDQITHFWCIC